MMTPPPGKRAPTITNIKRALQRLNAPLHSLSLSLYFETWQPRDAAKILEDKQWQRLCSNENCHLHPVILVRQAGKESGNPALALLHSQAPLGPLGAEKEAGHEGELWVERFGVGGQSKHSPSLQPLQGVLGPDGGDPVRQTPFSPSGSAFKEELGLPVGGPAHRHPSRRWHATK